MGKLIEMERFPKSKNRHRGRKLVITSTHTPKTQVKRHIKHLTTTGKKAVKSGKKQTKQLKKTWGKMQDFATNYMGNLESNLGSDFDFSFGFEEPKKKRRKR